MDPSGTGDQPAGVAVFAPSTFVTVTAESGVDGDEIHFHAGGQGFWVARMLGRLGVPTKLQVALGGESGRVAQALIETEPVDVRIVESADSTGAWMHDRRGGTRQTVADDAGRPLGRHAVDELYGATLAAAMDTGICLLAGPHRPTAIDPTVYERLVHDLHGSGVLVVADLSGDHLLAALASGLELCKVSHEDLASTDGFGPDGEPMDDLDRLERLGASNAVITRADRPLVARVGGETVEVAAPSFQVHDHRGAGDAFTAVVTAAAFWGMDWLEAVRWGAAAGALSVTRRGLATADRREIHQLLGRVTTRSVHRRPDGPGRIGSTAHG